MRVRIVTHMSNMKKLAILLLLTTILSASAMFLAMFNRWEINKQLEVIEGLAEFHEKVLILHENSFVLDESQQDNINAIWSWIKKYHNIK